MGIFRDITHITHSLSRGECRGEGLKILLLGEYSNVHATLAQGLREAGHEVTVVSNGDFWKNYPRDIDVSRKPGLLGGLLLLAKVYALLPRLRGYDVVQFINPIFFELKAKRLFPIFRYLKRHNGKLILGGFGMDYYWVTGCIDRHLFRYSDFNIGPTMRTDDDALRERRDWVGTPKERLNRMMAEQCDLIVTGLYEYWACYSAVFPEKTVFMPYPIRVDRALMIPENPIAGSQNSEPKTQNSKLKFFIGINKSRSVYKGTDIMLEAAKRVVSKPLHKREGTGAEPDLLIASNVPFASYRRMMLGSDVILDQLYSYTPAMNALEAMSHGLIVVGGGEPENYDILRRTFPTDYTPARPIVNVEPVVKADGSVDREASIRNCVEALRRLVENPALVRQMQHDSRDYIMRYHEYHKVARLWLSFFGAK